jgi:preprotein translocase subunit SecG
VKGNTGNISIKALLSLLSISVLSFALWTLITSLIKTPVLSFYNLLFTDTSESIRLQKTETLASSLFSGNYTPLEIIDILIKQLGIVAILFIIFLLIIPYIWRKINDDETYKNLVSLSLFAVLMSGFVILPFLTSSVSYEMGRPMFLIILVGVIYAGIYFSHLCISIFQDHTDHSRYKKILPMLGILLGIALICLSIISVYASTDTYQSSKQTTYGLVEGMDHYLTYHNPNFDTVQVGFFTPARFAQALYSSTYIRHDAYDYTYKSIEYVDSAPNNFNYSTSQLHLGNEYSSITYLAILDSTVEQFMQKARDEKLHQSTMTPTALYQLEYDDSVNKYYTNPSIVYYLIMAENKA